MNNLEVLSIVLALVAGVEGALLLVFPWFQRKGVNVGVVLDKAGQGFNTADDILNLADTFLPGNSIVNALKLVERYAHVGVNQAEQLYLTSKLPADKRNEKAKETIYAALAVANITVTPELEKIIDGAIETEVLALGHKTQKK